MAKKSKETVTELPIETTATAPEQLTTETIADIPGISTPELSVETTAEIAQADFPPGFEPISDFPTGFEPILETQRTEPTVGRRITSRFLGTDVDDPLELPRLGSIFTGATVGGIAGTRVPTMAGPLGFAVNPVTGGLLGSGVGAFLGVIAPESVMEFGEGIGALEQGTRERLGLSATDLRTVAEGEILLDLATGGGFTGLRLAGRGAAKLLTGATKEGLSVAQKAGERGIHLMPVQVGNRIISRGFVSVMGRFPLIGGKIRARGAAAEKALKSSLEGASERVGPLRAFSDISESIFTDARELVKATNKHFKEKYTALFKQAEELGVTVIPRETLKKADEILQTLKAQTPRQITGEGTPGPALNVVKNFIQENILPLREGNVFAKQSFSQMDGIISKIDQQLSTLEPGQRRFALSLLNQLRQAAQGDVIVNARGLNADVIARGLKELDTEFSHTMSELFETATAKQFGSVRRRGLRTIEFDDSTRIPIDQLARIVVKLDSPQAMRDLSKLVSPDTYKTIASRVIDDAVSDSMVLTTDVGRQFNPDIFAKRLGLDDVKGSRHKAVKEMLERTGTGLTVEDLNVFLDASRHIANLDLPNVSTFIARRATIGGIQGLINGMIPGLGLATAGAGAAAAGGTFVGLATFIGGGRLLSAILSKPESIRTFRQVAKQEAQTIFGRKGILPSARRVWFDLIRVGLIEMRNAGELTGIRSVSDLTHITSQTLDALDTQIRDLHGESP